MVYAARPIAVVALVAAFTGCSSSDSGSNDEQDSAAEGSAACDKAPRSLVKDISRGLTDPTYELRDAVMVAVPEDEQNTSGYPVNMVAANVVGEGGDSTAVGVWAVNTVGSSGPIFALNPPAQLLTDWGAAIQDGSRMAENREVMASSDSAIAAEACLT